MQFIRGLHNLLRQKQRCVATIGNFDGVHLGHHAVLEQLKEAAKEAKLSSTVVIFEPQPIEYFSPEKAPSRLTRLREKLQQFSLHDIDRVVCLRFDEKIATLSASEFVDNILINALTIKKIIVGDDFCFAKNRQGNYDYLLNIAKEKGFEVSKTDPFMLDQARVSSTLIRKTLASGDMIKAKSFLGRPYRIHGRVVHGDKRGRALGFATANVELHRYLSPVNGIFSGRVYGISNTVLNAVIYVGTRPVFSGKKVVLETHILDFKGDLYGQYIQVELVEKLRGDIHFSSEQELITQVAIDIENARVSLRLNKSESN